MGTCAAFGSRGPVLSYGEAKSFRGSDLTTSEREILRLLAEGLSSKGDRGAERSERTHCSRAYCKRDRESSDATGDQRQSERLDAWA